MIIDINAPISNKSIANIKLGSDAKDLHDKYKLIKIKAFYKHPYYKLEGFPLGLCINKKSNKISSISALKGYRGSLNKKFKIGDSISELINDYSWIFVDALEGFISGIEKNILIYTSLEDPDISELNKSVLIEEIYITCENQWDYTVWKDNPRTQRHQEIIRKIATE